MKTRQSRIDASFQPWRAGLLALGLFASVLSASLVAGTAHAASSCKGRGWLCLDDFEHPNPNSPYGNLFDDNRDWGSFGWSNRADGYKNDGATHNVCLYDFAGYSGEYVFIPNNTLWYYGFWDRVSSNDWTTGGSC